MFNPTWFYTGAIYAAGIWALRRAGVDVPRRVAIFFYALVFVFLYLPLTQDYVNVPVDFLKTLPPWVYGLKEPKSLNGQMNDLALQIVPWAHQVRESWRALKPPLWNEMSACGYPLLASAQSSALSPLRLLGLPLSLAHALTFEAAMKILIALTFMFLWCRRRHSELASVVGAVAFGFSTFIITWLHFPLITTACFVPAIFYLIDLIAEKRTYGRFVAGAAVWAVMLFGGHPETVAHTFFIALVYAAWIVFVERKTEPLRFFLTLGGALAISGLLAAPLLAPFAEAVTKSKRYQELQQKPEAESAEVPFSDFASAILLIQPHFWAKPPFEAYGPSHAESISGFAGYLGVAAWFALLAHVIAKRKWRSREMFFLITTLLVLGVILSWPGISDAFHLFFRLAANARLRLMLALLLAMQTAAAIDLLRDDRRSMLIGIAASVVLLLLIFVNAPFADAAQRNAAMGTLVPSIIVLAIAIVATLIRRENAHSFATLALLVALVAELWAVGRDWNPVIGMEWMYPKTPLLRALDELKAKEKEPFRIAANGATFFPNVSAVYGYEDIRAHDPMANGRYIGLLTLITNYDAANYFAEWNEWEKRFVNFLNVKYVITSWRGELPPRYRLVYDGNDGRIFENTEVLPRFFPVQNVIIDFNDDSFYRRLRELDGWSNTAILDRLDVEAPAMRTDFFAPRSASAPMAETRIVEATPTSYRIHVKAPRWSLVASSVPWWPGWKVERNGARVQPIRVNGGFLGFAVPEGELDVRVWYDPWTFRFGTILSLATMLALVAYGRLKK
ncbi:MAG TPA: YfhO family protein [Thermoanaerobaculia bacterium]|nr:YfhO family protein [Thermoanaerobaculia bacterium]